ncbi:MAG: L-2-hydroxyglutarate oxidase [Bryobacterales bacterium]|nr:L-2-hydroxyglutarate oxidase [Bryobacterales bacterium]
MPSIIIVGGGIIGLATAYRLGQRRPGTSVIVLEKEIQVGRHQTGHNSGVLHCGLYYKPGSIKAHMAVEGIRQMVEFCELHRIPHEICGKLVVAVDGAEVERLRELHERGRRNGLQGLRWLGREEMLEIEPNIGGVAGLRVPQEGIVDYAQVCAALVREITAAGNSVVTSAQVQGLETSQAGWLVKTTAGDFSANFVINCAGLHCDRVSALTGQKREVRIVPFRGEYYQIRPERRHLVRHLIYPVPDPRFPFLGVHFTRLIQGGIEAGPNAVLALAREGYRKTDINFRDIADIATYSGFWRFLAKYPGMCVNELCRSFSRRLFCESLQRLVPAIREDDLVTGGAGVRAQALDPSGAPLQDFYFVARPNALHVLNAPSPGATASLAIGDEIVAQLP